MNFGSYLKSLRLYQGLTLKDVEKKTTISNSYLSLIETGQRNPPKPDLLKKLASLYGVSLVDLMTKAGYLQVQVDFPFVTEVTEEEINRAFEFVINDPKYSFGTRLPGEIDLKTKRFVIEMYEKCTGKKLL